jgi:hypothetical protein
MNTSQKNIMIANFMQFKKDISVHELMYDCSWDWLMPVVAKIVRDEEFLEDENREYLMDILPYAHIEDTYDVVIRFIQCYNKGELKTISY